jgi:hypothetical protein
LIVACIMMEWLRWHLEGNIFAIVVGVLVTAAVIYAAVFGIPHRSDHHNGFGPDWECSTHEWGDPICVKKVKP